MAASDARPQPLRATAYRRYFAFRVPGGALVPGWTGAAALISIDGAAASASTGTVTEIGATGTGYLDFTAAEMTGDGIVVVVTVTNTDAIPLVFTFFPQEVADLAQTAEATWTATDAIETGWTPAETLRVVGAATAGINSGNENNAPIYRSLPNAKARIIATLDANQNRTAITYDKS